MTPLPLQPSWVERMAYDTAFEKIPFDAPRSKPAVAHKDPFLVAVQAARKARGRRLSAREVRARKREYQRRARAGARLDSTPTEPTK